MAFFKNFFNNIYDTVTSIPTNIGNWLYDAGQTIKNGFGTAVKQVGDWYKDFTGFTEQQNELKRQFNETMAQNKEQYETTEQRLNKELEYNKEVSDKNLEMQQNQFEYQKQLNKTQMEREDTAIQRQMADASAAGLSPLSVIGGNGASSTPLQSANAPQRDVSGINSITGQYVDLAKEYATLQNMTRTKYAEMRNGATMALMQMKSDAKYKALSAANSLFNSSVNAKNANLNREYLEEQIQSKRYENKWYKEHGWQNTNPAVLISDFLNNSNVSSSIRKLAQFASEGLISLSNAISKLSDNIGHKGQSVILGPEYSQDVINELNDEQKRFLYNYEKIIDKKSDSWNLQDWLDFAEYGKKHGVK